MIFSPHFSFFFFKSRFRKDKKCTDTLIRHKQIFCTNHISSDWLKKIAIRVRTVKSVRGYLFLEIIFKRPLRPFWNIPVALRQAGRLGYRCSATLSTPARILTRSELAPLLALLGAVP